MVKFELNDIIKVLVNSSTAEFIKKQQKSKQFIPLFKVLTHIGKVLKEMTFYPVSLQVLIDGKKQRIDIIVTDLKDYDCFMQLREFLDVRKRSMVGY